MGQDQDHRSSRVRPRSRTKLRRSPRIEGGYQGDGLAESGHGYLVPAELVNSIAYYLLTVIRREVGLTSRAGNERLRFAVNAARQR